MYKGLSDNVVKEAFDWDDNYMVVGHNTLCRLMDQQALQEQFKDFLEYLAFDFLEREVLRNLLCKCYQHLILDDPDDAKHTIIWQSSCMIWVHVR